MLKSLSRASLLAAAVLATVGVAHGETHGVIHGKAGGDSASATGLAQADQKFALKAAEGGLTEVTLGQHAADNAASDEVKKFGQRMVEDHTKANTELQTLAKQKGLTLPTKLDDKEAKHLEHLTKLKGDAFDKAYMAMMVKDHEKDVAEFKNAASKCHDADLKAFAAKTLPTLEDHLKLAKEIHAKMGKTSGK